MIDDPGQIFPGGVARGVKLFVEDGGAPAAVLLRRREADASTNRHVIAEVLFGRQEGLRCGKRDE